MKHILLVNGLDGPMRKQFGCDCARCADPRPQANVSVSLISLNEMGETIHHLLFDVGIGVVDSLVASPYLTGHKARLDGIILSHWHPDHTLGLNQICVSTHLGLKRRGITPPRIPFWCRSTTAAWIQIHNSYEWQMHLAPQLSDESHPPGTVLDPIQTTLKDVSITPISVSHFSADRCPNGSTVSYACAAFVVQTTDSKAVLLWDIDDQNEWLVNPKTEAEATAVDLLSNADHLFIDTCYWRRKPGRTRTTHASFENVMRYAAVLQPRETLLMHLSGHPDGRGNLSWGWNNEQWTAQAGVAWFENGLLGTVRAPNIGDEFEL